MRVEAIIRIPGAIRRLGGEDEVPSIGVYVKPDGSEDIVGGPLSLYIEGVCVGHVVVGSQSIRAVGERVYAVGSDAPPQFIVHETVVDCMLDLPTPQRAPAPSLDP